VGFIITKPNIFYYLMMGARTKCKSSAPGITLYAIADNVTNVARLKGPSEMARRRTAQAACSRRGWGVPLGACVSLSGEEEVSSVRSERTGKTGIYKIRICNGAVSELL